MKDENGSENENKNKNENETGERKNIYQSNHSDENDENDRSDEDTNTKTNDCLCVLRYASLTPQAPNSIATFAPHPRRGLVVSPSA